MLNREEKNILIEIAKKTIEFYLDKNGYPDLDIKNKNLQKKSGVFVTLKINDNLRGCIGQIESEKPLWLTVRDMAIEAAFSDPRFPPLTKEELKNINIEINVLSPFKRINDYQKIELGSHGVLVKNDHKSGLFLPQVAVETGWNLEEFMENLCYSKAGLEPNSYKSDPDTEIYIFEVEIIKK